MVGATLPLIPLIVICAVSAFVLAAAWRSFGHVPHALTWAFGFTALALMWTGRLLLPENSVEARLSCSVFCAAAVSLGAIGFRQRAQRDRWIVPLAIISAVQIGTTAAMALAGVASGLLGAPAYLQDLFVLLLCARTLNGRRLTERLAERAVSVAILAATLWIGLRLAEALGVGGAAELRITANIAQPAAVMAAGLFAIFLIAADLADKMRRLAATDRLTGLLNRRGLDQALGALLDSARRHQRTIVLVLTDIDRFKSINDRFGHATGDAVIRRFADCLTAGTARRDLVARIGGEEFAIVMTDTDDQAATCAAEVLREQVSAMRFTDQGALAITASFGLASAAGAGISEQDLLARADRALYEAKARGRNRVTLAA